VRSRRNERSRVGPWTVGADVRRLYSIPSSEFRIRESLLTSAPTRLPRKWVGRVCPHRADWPLPMRRTEDRSALPGDAVFMRSGGPKGWGIHGEDRGSACIRVVDTSAVRRYSPTMPTNPKPAQGAAGSSFSRRAFVEQSAVGAGCMGMVGLGLARAQAAEPGAPALSTRQVVDARSHGAKGDGQSDDTQAIQTALDRAKLSAPIC